MATAQLLLSPTVLNSRPAARGQSSYASIGTSSGLRLPNLQNLQRPSVSKLLSDLPLENVRSLLPRSKLVATAATATKQAYICRDCGYIYNERKSFESLPDDYRCPVCAAPKRKFKPYSAPVARNANETAARKSRKEQLKSIDSAAGSALPIAAVLILAALIGVYLYLNSQYTV